MAIPTYTKAGTKATSAAKLDKRVFELEVTDHKLLKDAYVAYLANGRDQLASTKTRGMVHGGGRKPWRQKGTGRARVGSSRNPIWRGGGIAFGPTGNENYSKRLNVKSKRLAIRQALSVSADDKKISVIEDIKLKDAKTAELVKLLTKINVAGNILLVVEHKSEELLRASRNLSQVKIVQAQYVNVFDTLNADAIVFTTAALRITTDWLAKEAKIVSATKGANHE